MLKGEKATPSLILFSRVQRSWNCKNILCGCECTHHPKSGVWRPDYFPKLNEAVLVSGCQLQADFTVGSSMLRQVDQSNSSLQVYFKQNTNHFQTFLQIKHVS